MVAALRQRQRLLESLEPLLQISAHLPEPPQRRSQPHGHVCRAGLDCPRDGGTQVVVILLDSVQRRALVGRHHTGRPSPRPAWRTARRVARAGRPGHRERCSAPARTRESSRASRSAARRRSPPTAVRGSSRPAIRACRARRPSPPLAQTSSMASSPAPPTKTERQANSACSGSSSMSWLQAIAPRSVCCRSGRSRAPPASSPSRFSSLLSIDFGREDPDARRRQLDGQRQPIEAHADLGHGRCVVVRDVEIGLHGARSLDEERDCLELRELREWRQVGGIGEAERRNRDTPARRRRGGCCGCWPGRRGSGRPPGGR